jgi:hypothetical protein
VGGRGGGGVEVPQLQRAAGLKFVDAFWQWYPLRLDCGIAACKSGWIPVGTERGVAG